MMRRQKVKRLEAMAGKLAGPADDYIAELHRLDRFMSLLTLEDKRALLEAFRQFEDQPGMTHDLLAKVPLADVLSLLPADVRARFEAAWTEFERISDAK